jgi:hypothetical protein
MKEIHIAFKIHTENSGVDLTKEDSETVNFGEGGDHTVDSIAKEITRQLKNLLEQRGIKLVDAVLAHSEEDNVIDNLLTGVRLGSFNKPQEQTLLSVSIDPEIAKLSPIANPSPLEEEESKGELLLVDTVRDGVEGVVFVPESEVSKVNENVIVSNADSTSTVTE